MITIHEMSDLGDALDTLEGALMGLDIPEACRIEKVVRATCEETGLSVEMALQHVRAVTNFVEALGEHYQAYEGGGGGLKVEA